MIQRAQTKVFFFIAATLLILACVPALAPAAAPIPTFDPNSVVTAIEATAKAAATQTALFITPTPTPTLTLTPSRTPTETPSPTATFLFVLRSPTPTTSSSSGSKKSYACTLVGQVPADNSSLTAGLNFPVRWQVKNTGSQAWDSNSVDYVYTDGTKMYTQPGYDLEKTILPDTVVDIIVPMIVPEKPGKYSTTWAIRNGKTEFCKLMLVIVSK